MACWKEYINPNIISGTESKPVNVIVEPWKNSVKKRCFKLLRKSKRKSCEKNRISEALVDLGNEGIVAKGKDIVFHPIKLTNIVKYIGQLNPKYINRHNIISFMLIFLFINNTMQAIRRNIVTQ